LIIGDKFKETVMTTHVKFPGDPHLKPYVSEGGESGIVAIEIGGDFIVLKFRNSSGEGRQIYLYNYRRPGKAHVDKMIKHALSKRGLNTYKNQNLSPNDYDAYWNPKSKKFELNDEKFIVS
jgi:hypothetical protein